MKRASGVLMHISSLWGEYSEGSLGKPATEWIDFIADCGFGVWQVLPFCVTDGFNSPYKSFSAFSLNPYFIDLDGLKDMGLLTDAELGGARQHTPYSCEFERLSAERMPLLALAAQRFSDRGAVREFLDKHRQTEEFCRFMALRKANNELPWNEWTVKEPDAEELWLWEFTQFIFFEQWRKIHEYAKARGVRIIGDIPIYVSWDSADVWANPTQFLLDERKMPTSVAGVPPDYFAKDGQLWGNPLYDWNVMRQNGFSWWKERISFMAELFDGVRIDHFRGIESYYSIPADAKTAKEGVWRSGPGMELVDAIKFAADGKLLIAEDLGDITDSVRELVEKSGLPGMRVLQFAFQDGADCPHLPHNYINNCVAYTGTHDNNTLLGFVWEMDDQTRKRLLSYCGFEGDDWNRCYDAVLRTMFASHSGLLILPVQDLLLYGSDTRLNVPGRSFGNWSLRITREQLAEINKDKFLRWNTEYGRKASN